MTLSRPKNQSVLLRIASSNQQEKSHEKVAPHYAIDSEMIWVYGVKSTTELHAELS